MTTPWLIAVSGPMGSGKSSLALGLARTLGFHYLPESRPALGYLDDLFQDPTRWAFETQLSFLCHKATQLVGALSNHHNVVLDRTLQEDIDVYAAYFHDTEAIDERAYTTYCDLADYFRSTIHVPDVVLYCGCSLKTARRRIERRGRESDRRYPERHMDDIFARYESWKHGYNTSPMYYLDSETLDWRDPSVIQKIAVELLGVLTPAARQMYLFEAAAIPSPEQRINRLLQPVRPFLQDESDRSRPTLRPVATGRGFPRAYIAAPFTARAEIGEARKKVASLFDLSPAHGRIRPGRYRRALSGLANALSKSGMSVVLPHRDVNEWGDKHLTPAEVVQQCTEQVLGADLFVGVPGESHGSHYEFGLALGAGKACVIIQCEEIPNSFIAEGISSTPENVLVLRCRRIGGLPRLITTPEATAFIRRFVPFSPTARGDGIEGRTLRLGDSDA